MSTFDSGDFRTDPAASPAGTAVKRVDPLSEPDWDRRVGGLPGAGFFHGSAWARVLRDAYGFSPVYHVLTDASGGWSVLPLMEVDSWLTGRRGIALPFTDESAPVCREADSFRRLFQSVIEYARARRWKYVELRGGRAWCDGATASTSFWGHQLELEADEAAQAARVESAARRAVRKAEKSGVAVEFAQDSAALRAFYDLLCLTRKRHGVPPQPWNFFAKIHRHILATGQGWVVLARHQNIPVAGAVFFHFGRTAIFKYGASDETRQEIRANNLVMWETIKRYGKAGYKSIDFGRTSLGNEGLRRFKLGWGSTERLVEYAKFDMKSGAFVTAPDDSSGWHNRVFRALPNSLSRLAGTLLYPHIA